MTKLNQIIAIEKGVKASAAQELTEAYHVAQKPQLWNGIARSYHPKDEDGDTLPPESTRVQVSGDDLLASVSKGLARLFDVTATKDATNAVAKATVYVDQQPLIEDVPVTYLLFVEKKLTDLHTFVSKLPVLDAADSWEYNEAANAYATPPTETVRTKKIPKNHVKAEATPQHPAQVEVYTEDVKVGTWSTIKYSGALPARRQAEILKRIEKLQQAVHFAQQEGNGTDVVDVEVGNKVFDYLFAS